LPRTHCGLDRVDLPPSLSIRRLANDRQGRISRSGTCVGCAAPSTTMELLGFLPQSLGVWHRRCFRGCAVRSPPKIMTRKPTKGGTP
jgi:hypothetical protein